MANKTANDNIYKSLVEGIPAVTYIADFKAYNWTYVSPQIRSLLGYTAEEWMKQPGLYSTLLHPEDRERIMKDVSKDSGYFSSEYRMIRKDGSVIWVRDEGVIRKGAFYGFLFDITREKELEQKANESEQRHRELLEDIEAIVWDADPVTFRASYVSHKAISMLGYPIEDWQKPNFWMDHVLSNDREPIRKKLQEAIADPTQVFALTEYRFFTADHEIRWLRDQVHLIRNEEGNVVRIRGITLDITDEKQREEERSRLEEHIRGTHKFEAIGRLAGGIAHDFNNLLMAITSYCDLIKLKTPNAPKELEEIQKAAGQGSALTRHLLAFGGKQIQAPRPVDLNQVLQDLEPMLKRMIREDVEIVIKTEEELGIIQADVGQLSEIIINLAATARESMVDGGRFLLETSNVTIDRAFTTTHPNINEGQYVCLCLSDTGSGLDEEARDHIFEPFYVRKDRTVGAGLRLPAVYGIVKQTGGFIWVYSEPGQGTSVKIYFPRIDAQAEAIPSVVQQKPPTGAGARILVVDDNDAVRVAIGAYLEMNGFQILQAENGKKAIEIASNAQSIDVLITDLIMPQMGGIELSQQLILHNPELKVLYMSGYTEENVIRQGMLEPRTFFLQKPASMQVLLQKIRDLLGDV